MCDSVRNHQRFEYINLEKIIYLVKHGRLNPANTITIKDLFDCGAFKRVRYGVKVLSSVSDGIFEEI